MRVLFDIFLFRLQTTWYSHHTTTKNNVVYPYNILSNLRTGTDWSVFKLLLVPKHTTHSWLQVYLLILLEIPRTQDFVATYLYRTGMAINSYELLE
jgi:hypothetical protein